MGYILHSTMLLILNASVFGTKQFEGCDQPLGLEEGTLIPEEWRTNSRHNIYEDSPEYARLNRKDHPPGYRAKEGDSIKEKSVTVLLNEETIITGIATQGYGDPEINEWVSEYTLHWMVRGGEEEMVLNRLGRAVFQGNIDFNSTVRNDFDPIFFAKEFTIKPLTEHNNVGLRFELYGCKDLTITCRKENEGEIKNCTKRLMRGEQLHLEADLHSSTPIINVTYTWVIYKMTPTSQWEKVHHNEGKSLQARFIVIKGDLESGKYYRVNVTTNKGKRRTSTSSYDFTTNGAPRGGGCWSDRREGYALQTVFVFKCEGWIDMDKPLTYEFSYKTTSGLNILLSSSNNHSISTRLAAGDPDLEHMITVNVLVLDFYRETTNTSFSIKVTNDNSNLASLLYEFAVQNDSHIVDLLDSEKVGEAVILANNILTTMSYANDKIQMEDRKKVKSEIIKHMRRASVSDLRDVLLMASVVAIVTEKRDELSEETQESSVDILENITRVFSRGMKYPSTEGKRVVDDTASNLLHGIGNVLEKQSKDALDKSTDSTKVKATVSRVWNLVTDVGDGLLETRRVGDDPVEMKTKSMKILLARQDPTNLGKDPLEVGKSRVFLPPSDILLENPGEAAHPLDIQFLAMTSNPFVWDPSAGDVKSSILSMHLRNGSQPLNISNLSKDIQLNIETGFEPVKRQSFAKPRTAERMQKHVINLESPNMTLQIRIEPESGRSLGVYVRHGQPPTRDMFDFQATVPGSSCANVKELFKPTNCTEDVNLISVSSNITGHLGIHYIGVVADDQDRYLEKPPRRPCFENGRQRRSADCLQIKDPPTPTSRVIRPTYDPVTDVKYNMSVTIGTCLYLDESGRWTTEGCKVGHSHESGSLQCLCNHLSLFGGNLIVEPNPIHFDQVWVGFGNMGRDNNVMVITMVMGVLGFWIIVVVFARRADSSDEEKVTPPIMLPSDGNEEHCYEIKICTGVWRRCGTTANVAIILCGEHRDTGAIPLVYTSLTNKRLFGRGSINHFILPLKESLGDISHINIWHDNTGSSPKWFLRQVIIRDILHDTTWTFVCNRWLAAEKDDGKTGCVFYASSSEQINSFSNKFWSRASTGITDRHLWLSVLCRLPNSSFTRVQRASCCVCILLTVLVVNTMFYTSEKEQAHTIQIGVLAISLRQIIVGIQSSVIVVPLNLLIVSMFRNVKPTDYTSTIEYDASRSSVFHAAQPVRGLPHVFLYFAWALCLVTSLTAGAFTVFYSMAWGTEKSNEWLMSILVSISQDLLFIQPFKVLIIASLLASFIRKAPETESIQNFKASPASFRDNIQSVTPPSGPELENFRRYHVRVFRMGRIVIKSICYLTFAWALFVVCYGNRDKTQFLMTKGLQNVFDNKARPLKSVTNLDHFWNWTLTILVPGLYNTTWYNGRMFEYKEGFISNRIGYMVGMPSLRQLRVKPVPCSIEAQQPDFVRILPKCLPAYSYQDEYTSKYNSPGWRKYTGNVTICPKPWKYRDGRELDNLPYLGNRSWYGGGGYVAELGYTYRAARTVIKRLRDSNWTDEHTRAIFIEAMIYEPTKSLFSAVTYLYEVQPTGHGTLTWNIKTMSLYAAKASGAQSFHAICELVVFISVIYFLVAEILKLYRMRCEYVKSLWSWVELAQIVIASSSVILSNVRRYYTSRLVAKIHQNPFKTSSFHYVVWWTDMDNVFMAILVFIVTVKLLGILKFNRQIARLAGIMGSSARLLTSYAVVYAIAFLAFLQYALLCFGSSVSFLSSVTEVLRTQFSLIIGGEVDYDELYRASPFLGSLYFSLFMTIMGTIFVHVFLAILNESCTNARITSACSPEEQELLDTFLDYIKKRLSGKISRLRKKRLLPHSKQYDVARARATDIIPTACKYTRLDWPAESPRLSEYQDLDNEDTVLQSVERRMRSIRFSIHGYRPKKYEVYKYEMAHLNETSNPPNDKFSFTETLYQVKERSLSLLNINAPWKRTGLEQSNILSSSEDSFDFEYETTGSDTSSFKNENAVKVTIL